MTRTRSRAAALLTLLGLATTAAAAETPRPEHPTPDAVRPHWANLNGPWDFRFDPRDEGLKAGWEKPATDGFDKTIVVPFPWESELSGVHKPGYQGVAWYRRSFTVPDGFPKGQRVWLRFGAVDWRADVWVNGQFVHKHEGGYTPFEADITKPLELSAGKPAVVVVRVYDPTDPAQPVGKQVGWYTTTSGIWQTVWLEARPEARIGDFFVRTEVKPARAVFAVRLTGGAPGDYTVSLRPDDPTVKAKPATVKVGADTASALAELTAEVKDARLWSPETPHLYDVTLELKAPDGSTDTVKTYFGLRTIARGMYRDEGSKNDPFERVLLNGKPVYLRTALDQSFNPKGIYTAPDDAFLRRDLEIAKSMGLNGLRIHIKPDEPRRLYWADRLGLLILEDMPNTWRQNSEARRGWEKTMREAVVRDRNHPSIVTWVAFNETWGLGTPEAYKKDTDTQKWVGRMVAEIRKLDPTRLVEDNSPCNYDHVENTDLNSWHFYIDDHREAARHVDEVVEKTRPGSSFNYCPGQTQGAAPLINSEYGGISAGSGDRDISWSFRDLTTLLRRQPKIQGYVYTELDDIEWEHNGFVNYDRSPKEFGYSAFIPGMSPADLNGADFVGYAGPPVRVVKPGDKVTVPVFVSHYSDREHAPKLRWWVSGWDDEGESVNLTEPEQQVVTWRAYDVADLKSVTFTAPDRPFVGSLNLTLRDDENRRIAANFVNIVVRPESPLPRAARKGDHEAVLRFAPGDFARRQWSDGVASPPGKAFGQGKGFFEYKIRVPEVVSKARPESIVIRFEAASKAKREKVDWAVRSNPEDYPQTDARKWPSTLEISVNGKAVDRRQLPDDPADARGVLSHLARFQHGSHGEVVEYQGDLAGATRTAIEEGKPLLVRLSVPDDAKDAGGLCVFGDATGQYPFDPTVVIRTKDRLPEELGVKPGDPVALDRESDRRTVPLGAGDSVSPSEWAYTTTRPAPSWAVPGFDDSGWERGRAGFGTQGTPALRVATEWKGERIWLRKEIDLKPFGPDDAVTLRIFHDEDAEVYVNGKRLLKADGHIPAYRDVELEPGQRALFHTGKNTMAVSCRQTRGGQGIDVGLTVQRGD